MESTAPLSDKVQMVINFVKVPLYMVPPYISRLLSILAEYNLIQALFFFQQRFVDQPVMVIFLGLLVYGKISSIDVSSSTFHSKALEPVLSFEK